MSQFQPIVNVAGLLGGDGPNTLQIYTRTLVIFHCRVTAANAGLDGSGVLQPFTGGETGRFGAKLTSVRILSEDASPADTYRIFLVGPGTGAPRLFYSKTISAEQTVEAVDDLLIPPGWMPHATSNAGEDANIWLVGGRYD